jgi:hypothetical protein
MDRVFTTRHTLTTLPVTPRTEELHCLSCSCRSRPSGTESPSATQLYRLITSVRGNESVFICLFCLALFSPLHKTSSTLISRCRFSCGSMRVVPPIMRRLDVVRSRLCSFACANWNRVFGVVIHSHTSAINACVVH